MRTVERWDYDGEGIHEESLPAAPWDAVASWVDQARQRAGEQADMREPDAISVATVDPDGQPSVRTVLMRYLSPAGPGFYCNLRSRKALALAQNPRIAATLTWVPMFRAIRFEGTAIQLSREIVTDYFRSRPYGSRIGAWASHQSQPAASRAQLEEDVRRFEQRWPDHGEPDDVPLPDHWGGFVVDCNRVELWGGRSSRLHDRFVYSRVGQGDLADAASWQVQRLQP